MRSVSKTLARQLPFNPYRVPWDDHEERREQEASKGWGSCGRPYFWFGLIKQASDSRTDSYRLVVGVRIFLFWPTASHGIITKRTDSKRQPSVGVHVVIVSVLIPNQTTTRQPYIQLPLSCKGEILSCFFLKKLVNKRSEILPVLAYRVPGDDHE